MPDSVPPRAGISPVVLILAVLLAVAGTAAVVLALRPAAPAAQATQADPVTGKPVPVPAAPSTEPFTQKDTVSPKRDVTGVVNYPLPFSSPPHLKLQSAKRDYIVLTETEYGFTWAVRATSDDFEPGTLDDNFFGSSLKTVLQSGSSLASLGVISQKLKPSLQFEDFTWEAKGVAGKPGSRPATDTGSFTSLPNVEGEVAFGITFVQPPNVTFTNDNSGGRTTVSSITPTGFKWKNVTDKGEEGRGRGTVSWQAKGVKAEAK